MKLDYLVDEVGSLRETTRMHLTQLEALERNVLLASGAIWALVATVPWSEPLRLVIWFPSILTAVYFVKLKMITKTLHALGVYIKKVEVELDLPGSLGWQSYWDRHKYSYSGVGKSYLKIWARVFWFLLFVGNTGIAYFFPFQELVIKQ